MWLKRIVKLNNASPTGGAGSDLGVASDNVLGLSGGYSNDGPTREDILYNLKRKRRKNRKIQTHGIH